MIFKVFEVAACLSDQVVEEVPRVKGDHLQILLLVFQELLPQVEE